jgi:hypothetical protein
MFANPFAPFSSALVRRVAAGATILGFLLGSNALANPAIHRAPQARVGPNGLYTYTCIAQVSFIAVYPETITPDGGFTPVPASSGTELLGSEVVSGPTLDATVAECNTYTRQVYRANTARSNASMVCGREEPTYDSMTLLVYATNYFQELGNGNGVNRVDGLAAICDPTAKYTIQYTL